MTRIAENAVGTAARVVLVEDHPVFRKGLMDLLGEVEDLRVCGEAGDATEGSRVIDEVSPDLVLMDLSLPQGNALPLVRDLRNRYPALRILVVSMHEERMYAERALRAGADGYITKAEAVDRLIEAIREVLAGRFYLKPEWAAWLLRQSMRGPDASTAEPEALLSDRELEVFTLLGWGYSTREIAERLQRSPKTIDSHREHMKHKLGAASNAALLRMATIWVMNLSEN
ncbi:response regulator transcription factor [Halofilum ochraceum]|uniref:response regulator transcription factor n=1 Tax=Halofilum ochraceum TaxID=1611323 RepID=UPI001C2F7AC4|nr:response regulator transcription factor [Halofilum ochraceum]